MAATTHTKLPQRVQVRDAEAFAEAVSGAGGRHDSQPAPSERELVTEWRELIGKPKVKWSLLRLGSFMTLAVGAVGLVPLFQNGDWERFVGVWSICAALIFLPIGVRILLQARPNLVRAITARNLRLRWRAQREGITWTRCAYPTSGLRDRENRVAFLGDSPLPLDDAVLILGLRAALEHLENRSLRSLDTSLAWITLLSDPTRAPKHRLAAITALKERSGAAVDQALAIASQDADEGLAMQAQMALSERMKSQARSSGGLLTLSEDEGGELTLSGSEGRLALDEDTEGSQAED